MIAIVPDFQDSSTDTNPGMMSLKARLHGQRVLGLVRVSSEEYMAIYEGKHLFFLRTRFLQLIMWNRIRLLHRQVRSSLSGLRIHQMGNQGDLIRLSQWAHPARLAWIYRGSKYYNRTNRASH